MRVSVLRALVQEAGEDYTALRQGGGPQSALRAYQAFHPDAAIYTVTFRGRTVWMTSKQRAIWHEVQKYWRRNRRNTLETIANIVNCSRSTVLRFLRRLDLWRFIDVATVRGRNGGTYILTRQDAYNEKPQRWTMSKRARVRHMIAARIKRECMRMLEPMWDKYRIHDPAFIQHDPWWKQARQKKMRLFKEGSTGGTFRR